AAAEEARRDEDDKQEWDREHEVDEAHEQAVDPSTEVAGERPDGDPDDRRDERREHPDGDRDAGADDDELEDAPTAEIGPEQVLDRVERGRVPARLGDARDVPRVVWPD